MKKLERSALVSYSCAQMFDLVNDIEAYPQFMSGCRKAEVLERTEQEVTARLDLFQAGLSHSFTTRNELVKNEKMIMHLVDGPFKFFEGVWHFEPLDDNACRVTFRLQYQFSNPVLGLAVGPILQHMANEQVDAICQRAKDVY